MKTTTKTIRYLTRYRGKKNHFVSIKHVGRILTNAGRATFSSDICALYEQYKYDDDRITRIDGDVLLLVSFYLFFVTTYGRRGGG